MVLKVNGQVKKVNGQGNKQSQNKQTNKQFANFFMLGIGPKAAFSYDEMDVGDIFVESMHKYEVEIVNQVGL
jgi:hypothetical protein